MSELILELGQMQKMSTDEVIDAYRNGYRLSETYEIYSSSPITTQEVGIIVTSTVIANLITVAILSGIVWSKIRKEKEKLISDVKKTFLKTGIEKGIEKLVETIPEKIPVMIKTFAEKVPARKITKRKSVRSL